MKLFAAALSAGCLSLFMQACVSGPQPVDFSAIKVKSGASAERLEEFSDDFSSFDGDLWISGGIAYNEDQAKNFKYGDRAMEGGEIVFRTATGAFSKSGVMSNFRLGGEFDIQIDCDFDPLKNAGDMDQVVYMTVLDTVDRPDSKVSLLGTMRQAAHGGKLFYFKSSGSSRQVKNIVSQEGFHGTLRFVRLGDEVSAYYRNDADGMWIGAGSLGGVDGDLLVGFSVSNYWSRKRKHIKANHPLTVRFDNFKVNAAEEIVESDI